MSRRPKYTRRGVHRGRRGHAAGKCPICLAACGKIPERRTSCGDWEAAAEHAGQRGRARGEPRRPKSCISSQRQARSIRVPADPMARLRDLCQQGAGESLSVWDVQVAGQVSEITQAPGWQSCVSAAGAAVQVMGSCAGNGQPEKRFFQVL